MRVSEILREKFEQVDLALARGGITATTSVMESDGNRRREWMDANMAITARLNWSIGRNVHLELIMWSSRERVLEMTFTKERGWNLKAPGPHYIEIEKLLPPDGEAALPSDTKALDFIQKLARCCVSIFRPAWS